MGKTSFVLRKTWIPLFLGLTTEQAGELIQSIMLYQSGEETPPADATLAAIYGAIKAEMDADAAKYDEVVKQRAAAGRRGGYAKAGKSKQVVANANTSQQMPASDSKSKQNLPDSDCDSDNDCDSESEEKKVKEKARQKEKQNAVVVDNPPLIYVVPQRERAAGGG